MSDKLLFICKRGWKRHSKGDIINEWEWKRLAIESREQFFEPYVPTPKVEPKEVPAPVTAFEKDLTENLEKAGIDAEFKHEVNDGNPEVKATFKFKNDKTKNNI